MGGAGGGWSQYMRGAWGGGFQGKGKYLVIIANTKKHLQSDWLRGVQYWLYLYSVFNICTLLLNKRKNKKYNIRFPWWKNRNIFIKNKLIVNN